MKPNLFVCLGLSSFQEAPPSSTFFNNSNNSYYCSLDVGESLALLTGMIHGAGNICVGGLLSTTTFRPRLCSFTYFFGETYFSILDMHRRYCSEPLTLILDHANRRRKTTTTTTTGSPDVKLGSFWFIIFHFFLCLIKHITAISAFTQSPYFSLIACQLFFFVLFFYDLWLEEWNYTFAKELLDAVFFWFCNHLTLQLFLFCFSLDTFCKVRHSMFEYSSVVYTIFYCKFL